MGTKSIKSTPGGKAGVVISDSVTRITSNEDNGIVVDEHGVTLQGPLSVVSSTKHIKFGGLWTMQDPIKLSLPSTLATPTPVLEISPPTGQLEQLMKAANVMIQLLSSLA